MVRDESEPALAPEDVQALSEAFRQHGPHVRNALRKLGVQEANLDDAVQDVFVVLVRRIDDFETGGVMRAWLRGIARRVASTYRRSDARARRLREELPGPRLVESPEEAASRSEAVTILTQFLERLDPARADVFVLSEVHGLTGPEIAERLGINLNTVYTRLRASRGELERTVVRVRAKDQRKGRTAVMVPWLPRLVTTAGVAGVTTIAVLVAVDQLDRPKPVDDFSAATAGTARPEGAAGSPSAGGVPGRKSDPAGPHESAHGFSLRPAALDDYVRTLEQGVIDPLDLQFSADATAWGDTLAWLWGHWPGERFVAAERACAREAPVASACEFEFELVVERIDEAEGEVVHVRRAESSTSRSDCNELSRCFMQRAWLGRRGPLPPGNQRLLALSASKAIATKTEHMAAAQERALVEQELAAARADLAAQDRVLSRISRDHENYPHVSLSHKLAVSSVKYWEWRASQL